MSTTTPTVSLKASRLIKASRERVFAAWTNPKVLPQWIGCGTRSGQTAIVDLRVGGEYQLNLNSEEHGEVSVRGVYRVINPPAQLAFTWRSTHCETETLVTIDLIEQKDGTEVQIRHEGFTTQEASDNHTYGWTSSLESLEKLA